jgi:hypothetical protein
MQQDARVLKEIEKSTHTAEEILNYFLANIAAARFYVENAFDFRDLKAFLSTAENKKVFPRLYGLVLKEDKSEIKYTERGSKYFN